LKGLILQDTKTETKSNSRLHVAEYDFDLDI